MEGGNATQLCGLPGQENAFLQDAVYRGVVSIVDDDESVRNATNKLLRINGYETHSFSSAEDFLGSAIVQDTNCLVTDVRMPGMGGLALQERLLVRGFNVPIVFITAYPEHDSRKRAMEAGAVCFLNKPFDGLALIRCIEQALHGPE